MKKFFSIILGFVLLILCCSCTVSQNSSQNSSQDKLNEEVLEEQIYCGQEAYNNITKAAEACPKVANIIYKAWHYSIFEAREDFSHVDSIFICNAIGADYDTMEKLTNEMGFAFDEFPYEKMDYVIALIKKYLREIGYYSSIELDLNNAKTYIDTMSKDYEEHNNYTVVKKYYNSVSSYLEWLKSPSGAFFDFNNTKQSYENDIKEYKDELNIIYE